MVFGLRGALVGLGLAAAGGAWVTVTVVWIGPHC